MIIYKATNLINGKFYIGLTKNKLQNAIRRHNIRSQFPKCYFNYAMNKYGFESFHFEIIDTDAVSIEHLKQLEIWYIAELKPEYNSTKGGDGNHGWVPSQETKNKISQAHIGKPSPLKGKKMSEKYSESIKKGWETRRLRNPPKPKKEKIPKERKIRTPKPKKEKIPKERKKRNRNPHSEETKRKISIASKEYTKKAWITRRQNILLNSNSCDT